MGKRYYCDYCDRSFVDDIEARKKHILGSMHLRLKKEHYSQFKSKKNIVEEESAKFPCKWFLKDGVCAFGVNCKYSHYPADVLQQLKNEVLEEEMRKNSLNEFQFQCEQVDISAWLQSRNKSDLKKKEKVHPLSWSSTSGFKNYVDLPLSLQETNKEELFEMDIEGWG